MVLQAEADMSGNAAGASVSQQAYINLNKASWILTDVINVHPHLSHVESRVRFEAMHLVEVGITILALANDCNSRGLTLY